MGLKADIQATRSAAAAGATAVIAGPIRVRAISVASEWWRSWFFRINHYF
jgi:hypothetical protein